VSPARARGAAAALVQRVEGLPEPVVVVPDTGAALTALAAEARRRLSAPVIGVTGSVGKTSVKDLAAAVLGARYRVVASPRSFNTDVGVPLTLLAADEWTEVVVCEMGSRGRGHVAALCEVARPTIGVVTAVGPAHLEMFGSVEAVAEAKAELPEALPAEGTAVLNADDPVVRGFSERTPARVLRYGLSADAEVRGEDLILDERGCASFTLRTAGEAERVGLSVPGDHMASNALAAAACGIALGLSAAECAAALKEASVSPWRMETFDTAGGVRVVNDAYNANPMSMTAALKALVAMRGEARSIAVLGEMAELGASADREHERIGELAVRLGVDRLVVMGPGAARIAAGALREGVEPHNVVTCHSVEEALALVGDLARPGDVVLLKGSRRVGLERLAERLGEAR
jgi:UDP-N-acetylmuramoyl-tripeptide--D-alanyl-D-alanine ligase